VAEAAGVIVVVAVAVRVALAAVALTDEAAGAVGVAAPEHVLAALEASDADKAGVMDNARCSCCGCCDMLESEVARRAHGDDDHGDGAAPPTADGAIDTPTDDSDGGNDAGDSGTGTEVARGAETDTDGGEEIGAARGVTVAAALMTAAGAGETSADETGRDRGGAAGDAEGSGGG
jgi:hypothetical protein